MTNNGEAGSPPSLSSATFNNEGGMQQSSLSEDSPALMTGGGGLGDGRDNVNSLGSEGGEGGNEGGELGAILNGGASQQQQGGIGEVGLSKDDDSAIGAFSEPTGGAAGAGDLGDQRHMVDGSNGQGRCFVYSFLLQFVIVIY